MTAFDVTQWCDFVRGVADPRAEREMRERLESGDADARRTVDFLTRVLEVARTDQEIEVPEHAVRMAKAIASVQRSPQDKERSPAWRFLPVELVFDSLLEPARAGTRDLYPSFRQLSFRTEGFTVDVRLEPGADPGGTAVVGQVLESRGEPRPVAGVPVLMTAAGRIVGRSVTSRFGEFHAEGLPKEPLDLVVLVGPETGISMPLDQEEDD